MPVSVQNYLRSQLPAGPQGPQGAAATPGGATDTVQYNNNGVLGGSNQLSVNTSQNAVLFSNTYIEKISSPAISTGTLTINIANGTVFNVALTADITTFTITNTPTVSDYLNSFVLILNADGTARTVSWGSTSWVGGTPPTLTSTNGKKDVFVFFTPNAGTNWYAFISGQNL